MSVRSGAWVDGYATATIEAVDRLAALCAQYELSAPPPILTPLRERVASGAFRVLVAGEVKRGKSTFINALLGERVLPHDLDVATSQVFRVRRGEEAYRLRFEDGTARAVTRADLTRYGSQVAHDEGLGATAERALRWIEVDLPAPFLPERVELLDSPGTGARYAAHAEVTRRFVPLADAVLFVLDSSRPIDRQELGLLGAILEVTQSVFFVQTKIDVFSPDAWEATRDRNEAILRQYFGAALPGARVWPVSSTNLLDAGDGPGAETMLGISEYPELSVALREFLAAVCGAPRAAEALGFAQRHHEGCGRTLQSRLDDVQRDSKDAADAHVAKVTRRNADYERDWGPNGVERRRLRDAIASSGSLTRQAFRDALDPGGPGATALADRIDAAHSAEEANRLGEELASDVVALAMDEWARASDLHRTRCAEAMQPFLEATEELVAGADLGAIQLRRAGEFARTEDHLYDRVRGSVGYSMPMWAASSIVISVIASPLALAAAAGGVLWALSRGWRVASDAKGKAARGDLHKHLRELLLQVSRHFFAVDLKRSQRNRVDEYLSAVEASLEARIDTVAAERKKEVERELMLLAGQANLGHKAREQAIERHRAALEDWDALGADLARLLADERAQAHLGSFEG